VLGAAIGVVVGAEFTGLPLFVRFLIGGVAGLAVYWGVPTLWAGVAWARAPSIQRHEAREYAQALEAYTHNYAQWARCLVLAYDFRWETFFDAQRIDQGNLVGSVADEEKHWRTNVEVIGGQMNENGIDVSDFMKLQLAALDDADGAFGGDDVARIRNSMLAVCQNLLSDIPQVGPPTPPAPP
jgi:hypothetical protein